MNETNRTAFGNLLADLPDAGAGEAFETLLDRPGLRIVRIVSAGQATQPGEWFDQDEDEWVLVIAGAAGLRVEGEADIRALNPGDHAFLPARCRHRVEWTAPDTPTVWLAVHMNAGA